LNIFNLIIIVSALSTEAFSGIYLNGFLRENDTLIAGKAKVVLFVTLINLLMGVAGFFSGVFIKTLLSEISYGISLGLVFILGLKLVIKSFKPKFQEMIWELTRQKVLIGFSFALGINTFLLGIALPGLKVSVLPFIISIILIFFFSTLLALIAGARSNRFLLASRVMLFGGVIISGSAIYYIIENFHLI